MAAACDALQVSRATLYRRRRPATEPSPRPPRHRALRAEKRAEVLATLNEACFADKAPAEVHGTLPDDGTYLCSIATMYRILRQHQLVRERRNQLQHPTYTKPELLATGPNQLWSWDITKLEGPEKWNTFHLYVILDVFSRYVVGFKGVWLTTIEEAFGDEDLAEGG